MSILRTSCPACCQPRSLWPDEVVLHLQADPSGQPDVRGRYVFVCATCDTLLSRVVDGRSLEVMRAAGVVPTEVVATDQVRAHPPLALDDLLDLHQLLCTDTWFEQLLTTMRAAG